MFLNHDLAAKYYSINLRLTKSYAHRSYKGGVHLEAGYGILAPIFRFFVQLTWKNDIAEGLDGSLRCQSFKP